MGDWSQAVCPEMLQNVCIRTGKDAARMAIAGAKLYSAGGVLAVALGACALYRPAPGFWTEDALQPDGRVVKVERTVYYNFGGGELSQAIRPQPDEYAVRARHPETGERVSWSGTLGWNPIMMGFLGKGSYLVLYAFSGR